MKKLHKKAILTLLFFAGLALLALSAQGAKYDIGFALAKDARFVEGNVITVKPGGSFWSPSELADPKMEVVTLELSDKQIAELEKNVLVWMVDSTTKPSAIVGVPK